MKVERVYRNNQPFHPDGHVFGVHPRTGIPHGDKLERTVDVAERLSRRDVWHVENNPRLDFRYLDREVALTRAKPKPTQDPGTALRVDLLLANCDRTPVQLLTQAAYAVTPSQRERLVLFGSRPEFVLREAVPGEPAPRIDLYVLLVELPNESPYGALLDQALTLSKALMRERAITSRVRRIAWIKGVDEAERSLSFHLIAVASSRRPIRAAAPQ